MLSFFITLLLALSLSLRDTVGWKIPCKIKKVAAAALLAGGVVFPSAPAQALSDPEAIARFSNAAETLSALDGNWEKIVAGQGDNIRRELGTVYSPPTCTSPLCSFSQFVTRFIKAHPDDLDVEEFQEPMADALDAINQADFLAYSAVFAGYGNGGNGQDFIGDSRKQIKVAAKKLKLVVIDLKRQVE